MEKTISLKLSDAGVAAYAELQAAGIDAKAFMEHALVQEGHRLRGRAVLAAQHLEHERQHVDLEELRDVPHQIDYVRPPR